MTTIESEVIGTQTIAGVCLRWQSVFPFSPSALQASLQTSTFQVRNRTTGAAMSLMKQSGVKDHLSPGYRSKIDLCESMSLPDATGYSMAEPTATGASQPALTRDYSAEHTIASILSRPTANSIGSTEPKAPETSKSSQQ